MECKFLALVDEKLHITNKKAPLIKIKRSNIWDIERYKNFSWENKIYKKLSISKH
jgi:hypothetical protein